MNPVAAITACFQKTLDFKGRARRSEYWWFIAAVILVNFIFQIAALVIGDAISWPPNLISFAMLAPMSAAADRRLHDTGRSGWWQIMPTCIVIFGAAATLVLAFNSIGSVGAKSSLQGGALRDHAGHVNGVPRSLHRCRLRSALLALRRE